MRARILLAAAVLLTLLGTGCQVVDQDRMPQSGGANIPWNTQAGWESAPIMGN